MITTITLNPAVDKTCTTARFIPGQVNRMDTVKNIAGGKGINVTKVLRQYDYPVRALGLIGGYTGSFIESYISGISARCDFTHIKGETRSSINIVSQDGYVTEILEPGPEVETDEWENFLKAYDMAVKSSELLILSGSVPAGIETDVYSRLIRIAKERGKKVLLDSSGSYLKEGVKALPYMIKPNQKELEFLIGKKIKNLEDTISAALRFTKTGIQNVLVSMGDKGLLYVCGNEILFAKAPRIKAVNTVGCGDSTVAAFAMSYMEQDTPENTLRKAAAIAAANATTMESAVIPMDTAAELMNKIEIEKY